MFGLSQRLNTILALFLALVLAVHCAPADSEAAHRDEVMRALLRLNDQNSYRLFRASRSNGKPTFIRFGKRSAAPVVEFDQAEDF